MRLDLVALQRARNRIEREAGPDEAAPLVAALDAARAILEKVATSLETGTAATPGPAHLQDLQRVADQVRGAPGRWEEARHGLDALAGQLRAILDLNANSTLAGREACERRETARPRWLRLQGTAATLRANLDLRSAALQHAIRLALTIGAGQCLARFLGQRAYWIPMTIAIVLKPDFTTTYSRGILRLAGTFLGLLVATALFEILAPNPWMDVALIVGFGFLLRAYGPANYGVFVFAVSAMVVLMFAAAGEAPSPVIAERGRDTVLGGLMALAAYAAWPTWERSQVSRTLAALLDAYRAYFRAIRDSYEQPEAPPAAALDHARLEARLARSNLEASAARLASEPGGAPNLEPVTAILASSHRLVHAFMAGDPVTERYALVNVETDRITNSLNTLTELILPRRPDFEDTSGPRAASDGLEKHTHDVQRSDDP